MKKRVPIIASGAAALFLALGPALSASAWSSVVVPSKPADCGSNGHGSSSYTSSKVTVNTYAPSCYFGYTLAVNIRYSGGGYTTPNAIVTNGSGILGNSTSVVQIANYSGTLPYLGGHHQFASGQVNS